MALYKFCIIIIIYFDTGDLQLAANNQIVVHSGHSYQGGLNVQSQLQNIQMLELSPKCVGCLFRVVLLG